jgi:hypothetical protein
MTESQSFYIALFLRPFAYLGIVAFFLSIRFALLKHLKHGWLKKLLLRRII